MSHKDNRIWPASITALALSGALAGCSDTAPHVFTAQPYDADANCLGEYEPIGLVQASELSAACDAACLEFDGTLYVSTLCEPYPDGAELLAPDVGSPCRAALSAAPCE